MGGITDWKVGDWAIYVTDGAGTDGWQKVDNSSVLDGQGTGQTVALWSGSGDTNTLTNSPITVSGDDVTFAGYVNLLDNEKAIFGTGGAGLEIYRDANDSRIVDEDSIIIKSQHIAFQAGTSTETIAHFYGDSSVELYYDGAKKFETTTTGVTVTGDISAVGGSFTGLVTMTDRLYLNDALNNTFIGANTGLDNTTGEFNSGLSSQSLITNTTGSANVALGYQSLLLNTTGGYNTALGHQSLLSNTTGGNNVALGYKSGRYIADGTTENETGGNSIFIGQDTRANADGETNQIVIGDSAIGNGSNTVTLGNDSIATTYLKGDVNITGTITGVGGEFLPLAGGTLTGALSGTSATFTDDVTIDNSSPELYLTPDASKYSWMIAAQENVDQHFEITPSTTVGGTAFSTPALKINGVNSNATFAGNVTLTGAVAKLALGTLDTSISTQSDIMSFVNSNSNDIGGFSFFTSPTAGGTVNALRILGTGSATFSQNATFAGGLTGTSATFAGSVTVNNSGDGLIKLGGNSGLEIIHNNAGNTIAEIKQLYAATSNAAQLKLTGGFTTFHTGTSGTESMRITSGGNVGIGTATFDATYDAKLQVTSSASDGTGGILIESYLPTLTLLDISGGASASQLQQDGTNMVFKNSGSERMRIDSAGNVGIGTDSPQEKLHIDGNVLIGKQTTTADQVSKLKFRGSNGSNELQQLVIENDGENGRVEFQMSRANGALQNVMTFGATVGNVGIGTDSPAKKLEILSTDSDHLRLAYNETAFWDLFQNSADGSFRILKDNGSLFTFTQNGSLGIGTDSPNGKLSFENAVETRKIVLYEAYNNDYQFYGIGIESNTLLYTTANNTDDHVFFSGATDTTRKELMRIEGDGNVGIGTNSPSAKLHITKDNTSGNALLITNSGSSRSLEINHNADGTGVSDEVVRIMNNGTRLFTIEPDGNVGIGTDSPDSKLDVNGDISAFASGDNNGFIGNSGGTHILSLTRSENNAKLAGYNGVVFYTDATTQSGGTERMRIDSEGNVGIGTTSPAQKLTISQNATGTGQGVPATTGTTQNGILRLEAGGTYGECLDIGMNVSTTYAWIQPVNKGNLSVNYNLALNPNGGNVGIGTDSPGKLLTVEKTSITSSIGDGESLRLANSSQQVGNRNELGFSNYANTHPSSVILGTEIMSTAGYLIQDFYIATRSTSSNIAPTERMRIASDGAATFASTVQAGGYKSSDGTAGITHTENLQNGRQLIFKNGLLVQVNAAP